MLTGCDPTKACFKRSCWFGKWRKTDAFTKLGEPTIRAACTPRTVLDRHFCLFRGLFFTGIRHLRHRLTVPPTKACLLCATPAGTYRVQSPGFPKIVYCCDLCIGTLSREVINRQCVSVTNISQEHPHTQPSRQNSAHA